MGSHSDTHHPAQVNTPCQAVLDSPTPEGWKAELKRVAWLNILNYDDNVKSEEQIMNPTQPGYKCNGRFPLTSFGYQIVINSKGQCPERMCSKAQVVLILTLILNVQSISNVHGLSCI